MVGIKLLKVQQALKAPKDKYNQFGKFKYRSCESILEAVKPLLAKEGLILTLSDAVDVVNGSAYVIAEARLSDTEDHTHIEVKAYAREAGSKAGMDAAQITGSASSYARKYALNGLFLIDDAKDLDTDEYAGKGLEKIDAKRWSILQKEIKKYGLEPMAFIQSQGFDKPSDITYEGERSIINALNDQGTASKPE